MDAMVRKCDANRVNIDILVKSEDNEDVVYGVRLRPWSNSQTKGLMVLGSGPTTEAALGAAVKKAELGDWETLDWAQRPWGRRPVRQNWGV